MRPLFSFKNLVTISKKVFLPEGISISDHNVGFPGNHTCNTVCPRSSDPFCVVTYCIKWVTTSWTYCISNYLVRITGMVAGEPYIVVRDGDTLRKKNFFLDIDTRCFKTEEWSHYGPLL